MESSLFCCGVAVPLIMPLPFAANWGLRLAGAITVVAIVKQRFGTSASLIAMVCLSVGGFLPPVFPLLYRLYTTRVFGYRMRHILHPRMPAHSTTIFGARRLLADGRADASASAPRGSLLVLPISALADNYSYFVGCERTRQCALIDPADPVRTRAVAKALGYTVTHVLTTHKHWDHAGGNDELKAALPSVTFVGSRVDKPAACGHLVDDGDTIRVGDGLFTVIATPGHTTGHVMYSVHCEPEERPAAAPAKASRAPIVTDVAGLLPIEGLIAGVPQNASPTMDTRPVGSGQKIPTAPGQRAIFTGDCIFCGGCGAMFECRSAADILVTYDVLHRLHQETPDALVYVGHEYSQRLFTELVESSKGSTPAPIQQRFKDILQSRRRRECTVPSTLRQEATSNPLMTFDRGALVQLGEQRAEVGSIEQQIYSSDKRRSHL
jgi:hydroxyacylglutathione hydrolase